MPLDKLIDKYKKCPICKKPNTIAIVFDCKSLGFSFFDGLIKFSGKIKQSNNILLNRIISYNNDKSEEIINLFLTGHKLSIQNNIFDILPFNFNIIKINDVCFIIHCLRGVPNNVTQSYNLKHFTLATQIKNFTNIYSEISINKKHLYIREFIGKHTDKAAAPAKFISYDYGLEKIKFGNEIYYINKDVILKNKLFEESIDGLFERGTNITINDIISRYEKLLPFS